MAPNVLWFPKMAPKVSRKTSEDHFWRPHTKTVGKSCTTTFWASWIKFWEINFWIPKKLLAPTPMQQRNGGEACSTVEILDRWKPPDTGGDKNFRFPPPLQRSYLNDRILSDVESVTKKFALSGRQIRPVRCDYVSVHHKHVDWTLSGRRVLPTHARTGTQRTGRVDDFSATPQSVTKLCKQLVYLGFEKLIN